MLKGIDIGGSFVKVLWEDGKKEKHYIKDIKKDRGLLLERLRKIIRDGNPEGVGIAVAGFTSLDGTVVSSPNLRVLDGVKVKELAGDIPAVVGNDVSLGAFGEWFYDHRESSVLLYVAVGTGLGAGLVVKGEVFWGACGSSLELGHHIVEKGGEICSCGRRGCLEAYCSSYGIEREYRRLTGRELRDYEVVERAKKGEREALMVVERFREYLSLGLMNALHLFNPDRVVLGGGVIKAMRELLSDLEERVKALSERLPSECCRVVFSRADEFGGARGALAYIRKQLKGI